MGCGERLTFDPRGLEVAVGKRQGPALIVSIDAGLQVVKASRTRANVSAAASCPALTCLGGTGRRSESSQTGEPARRQYTATSPWSREGEGGLGLKFQRGLEMRWSFQVSFAAKAKVW